MPNKPKLLPEEREAIIGKPFYSALDRAAGALKRKVGTGAEFMKELQGMGGIKQAEIEDRRLVDLMNAPKMTHDEMLHELQAHQTPQIQERILKNNEPDEDEVYDLANRLYHDDSERGRGLSWDRRLEQAREIITERNNAHNLDAAQFEKYTLPGGHNYREMLLHLPIDRMHPENNFKSSHFGVPNILAHMRLKDRRGPNGEKLLHLEELQSDWHQQGREKGYGPKMEKSVEAYYMTKDGQRIPVGFGKTKEEAEANIDVGWKNLVDIKYDNIERKIGEGVPDAPFKKNWEEMALKRLIHHAAENNYDGIVVTPGAEQADRYSLAQHVDRIAYHPYSGNIQLMKNGKIIHDAPYKISPEELPSYVGKEVADRLLSSPELAHGMRQIQNEDIRIGGEGMKGFYDKKVPNILNGIGKKYGVKTQLGGYNMDTNKLHYFPITEDMKKDVLSNGLPMYRNGGLVQI